MVEDYNRPYKQIPICTEHAIHGGMYARTIRLGPGIIITGALIKIATMLIVEGCIDMLVNTGWTCLDGYNVIAASAGRKQIFVTRSSVCMTMIFPSQARTVEDAETQFTDEAEILLSRHEGFNDTILITGE
jgi:hypothetical protein